MAAAESRWTTPEKFWALVRRGDADACWPWVGRVDDAGYGRVGYQRRSNVGAHRVAFALASNDGVLPDDWVLHRCDNPPCCNAAHLFLGDAAANNRDREEKGRTRGWAGRRGAKHHAFVVTDAIADRMRERRAAGATQQSISDEFGISRGHVARIVAGVLPLHAKGHQ